MNKKSPKKFATAVRNVKTILGERKIKLMKPDEIIKALRLKPLEPEGGFFREIFRSDVQIDAGKIRDEYGGKRSLFTAIYYLITDDKESAPHIVRSDEIWFFHIGDPILLKIISPDGEMCKITLGSDISNGQQFQAHIPAGWTQSAKLATVKTGFALVSTVVVPGFDYDDFSLAK